MKVLNKKKLMSKKQLKYAVSETNILKRIAHPFVVSLYYSFQTPSNLYLGLDYCPYGDLS
jgi:serum/glucocorticoid-regulated kinase 2